jgi:nitronate monooxygenase
MRIQDIRIIQGGMGIRVSSWPLAKAVAQKGQLGVVSGTAIDAMVARVLQLGDKEGHIRHALSHFPFSEMAKRVKDRFFDPEGKSEGKPFKGIGMPGIAMKRAKVELLIVSNFVEIFLAKEGHNGWVGVNYLEKIQSPTLPSLFGAMLAGANVVLMGAGIPASIPGFLDGLANWQAVSMRVAVENPSEGTEYLSVFDPNDYLEGQRFDLPRPAFLAIVSTDIIAKSLEKKATGKVDGYVLENYTAGGHNAPPRRDRTQPADAAPYYGAKDDPDLAKVNALGKPFWLAGQYAYPDKFKEALAQGATGIQVGTPFAYSDESDIDRGIKDEVIRQSLAGTLEVETSFIASPTGYPFKLVKLKGNQYTLEQFQQRKRVCDLGYLRTAYVGENDEVGWRCPAEPVEDYVKKGGNIEDTEGRLCLCNGLASTVGLGQSRKEGMEPPLLTSGDDLLNLKRFVPEGKLNYSASDVIDYILG